MKTFERLSAVCQEGDTFDFDSVTARMSSPGVGSRKARGKSISTFCRIKPTEEGYYETEYHVLPSLEEGEKARQVMQFVRPTKSFFSSLPDGRKSQEYTFNEVFTQDSTQPQVFDRVGKDVIDNVLKGFNGTIFAYGQTATGKTYTIMGEDLEYESGDMWGLVPRALEYIFAQLNQDASGDFKVKISFLEIYREVMFDLLTVESFVVDKKPRIKKNKVTCKMDDDRVRLEGLCLQEATDSNHALDLFLEGFQSREVAQTYANDNSSRSHAVFTVYITQEDDTGTLESKLHFVDLAGSERVTKDQLIDERLISEAKEINRSLLFLHKVIKSISSGHKPETFRNTMITKILRDSLIGNSMTSLIATISLEERNFDETLATCDFAHSVSKVKTRPKKNRTEDPYRLIEILQQQNRELQKRIALIENQQPPPPPTPPDDYDKDDLTQRCVDYYNDASTMLQVRENDDTSQFCFTKLKEIGKNDNKVVSTPLTDQEMKTLDEKLSTYIGNPNSADAEFEMGENQQEAQYCIKRLKQIVKDFDVTPRARKKKGCCC